METISGTAECFLCLKFLGTSYLYAWWGEGVILGQYNLTVVNAPAIHFPGASKTEMPMPEVGCNWAEAHYGIVPSL